MGGNEQIIQLAVAAGRTVILLFHGAILSQSFPKLYPDPLINQDKEPAKDPCRTGMPEPVLSPVDRSVTGRRGEYRRGNALYEKHTGSKARKRANALNNKRILPRGKYVV